MSLALLMMTVMIVLLFLGFPLVVTLICASLTAFFVSFEALPLVIIPQQMIGGIQPAALIAVPMFILAAEIMTRGKTADSLLNLVESFVGHLRGGLPITAAMSCTLFGAISGSTQATVVAIGQPLRPKLMQNGYSDKFATALIINSSDIALLIPPSIGLIVYGVVSGTSIGDLFLGGIGPGLFVLACFCFYSWIVAKKYKVPTLPQKNWQERLSFLKKAVLPLGFPVLIIGGIYGGFFSPVEAAALSVLYALILECIIYRELHWRELGSIAFQTGLTTAVVFLLVAAGAAFSWVISYAQLPQIIVNESLGLSASSSPTSIMFTMCIAYFVGCMFVDPIVVILILAPIFHPIAVEAGLHPVHVGVLVTLQAAIGSATPPFGCDIFTAVAIFKKPYLEVIRGTPPFIFILLLVTLVMIFVPELSLFLL
tara:strand:- start:1735 stop:3012 length:1278 start_codon:yes stop_codon:yes gene_type:complete